MAKNYTKAMVAKAIRKSSGLVLSVANNLECEWHTANTYIKKFKLEKMLSEENEKMVDYTESKLFKNIDKGKEISILFHLKTKGKKRGYIESQKIEAEVKGELTLFDLFNKKKNKDDSGD